ncbi:MAG: amidase [Pseudomonadota bacterium]
MLFSGATSLVACAPPAAEVPLSASETPAVAIDLVVPDDDVLALSLPDMAAAIADGTTTSEALVTRYLARIEAMDRQGPKLHSMIALNPDALDQARERDAQVAAGATLGPLHGVPIVLKDNIESLDSMATTAGALALADNVTGRDAPLVAGLREAGAVILGKTNLSQWANFRSYQSSSGWSAVGGQVRNPHVLDRNPCGSSSGSGAAVAAWLAAGAVGTETNGSIICPSNVQGIVGFKPTVGLVSQKYIIPISATQDTAGPMTRTVRGAALMLGAMDDRDVDYLAQLDAEALRGRRVGVLRFALGNNPDVQARFEAALDVLRERGAVLVDVERDEVRPPGYGKASLDVLLYEFKAGINDYLADAAEAVTTRDLAALIEFNKANADSELALFDQSIFDESLEVGDLTDERYIEALELALKATREDGMDGIFATHEVDVVVAPSGPLSPPRDPVNGDVWPDWAGAGWMAAVAGYPHATVPMGTVHGIPVGLSFMGARGDDAGVLSAAFAYEQASQLRASPAFLNTVSMRPELREALERASKGD